MENAKPQQKQKLSHYSDIKS